jgi:hypothetical protein
MTVSFRNCQKKAPTTANATARATAAAKAEAERG